MNLNKIFKNCVFSLVLVSAPLYPWHVKTSQDVGDWLKNNFTYQSEEGDYWKTPEETVKDKGGDCEDTAILAEKILRDLGYKAWFIVMTNRTRGKSSHAITILREKDMTYSFFSNTKYYKANAISWELMLDTYWPAYKNVYICKSKSICKNIYTINKQHLDKS